MTPTIVIIETDIRGDVHGDSFDEPLFPCVFRWACRRIHFDGWIFSCSRPTNCSSRSRNSVAATATTWRTSFRRRSQPADERIGAVGRQRAVRSLQRQDLLHFFRRQLPGALGIPFQPGDQFRLPRLIVQLAQCLAAVRRMVVVHARQQAFQRQRPQLVDREAKSAGTGADRGVVQLARTLLRQDRADCVPVQSGNARELLHVPAALLHQPRDLRHQFAVICCRVSHVVDPSGTRLSREVVKMWM